MLNGAADENVTEGERDFSVVAELKRIHADVEGLGSASGQVSVDDSSPGSIVVFAPAQFAETLQQRVVVAPDGSGRVMRRSRDIGVGVRDEAVVEGRVFRRQIPDIVIVPGGSGCVLTGSVSVPGGSGCRFLRTGSGSGGGGCTLSGTSYGHGRCYSCSDAGSGHERSGCFCFGAVRC